MSSVLSTDYFTCPEPAFSDVTCDFEVDACAWTNDNQHLSWMVRLGNLGDPPVNEWEFTTAAHGGGFLATAQSSDISNHNVASMSSGLIEDSALSNTRLDFYYRMLAVAENDYLKLLMNESGIVYVLWESKGREGTSTFKLEFIRRQHFSNYMALS